MLIEIIMFSSRERLQEKTPPDGIDRKEFINLLVDEYYETTNSGTYTVNLKIISFVDTVLSVFIRISDFTFYFLQRLKSKLQQIWPIFLMIH